MRRFLFLLCASCTAAEIYLYTAKYTTVTGTAGLPKFTAVSFVHGKQIDYYDSKCHALLPRQEWAKSVFGDSYWQKTAQLRFAESLELPKGLSSAMKSSGHKEGVHTFQRMFGCLWDQDSGHADGFDVYGYDGVDFMALDLESRRFIALGPEAESMAKEWNRNTTQLENLHLYYTHECVAWLKTFFENSGGPASWKISAYGQLSAIVIPTITFHLKRSFPPAVLCHVIHLSSKTVQMFWEKNEKDVDDYVEIGETLPSSDGHFQKTIYLFAGAQELITNQYKCVLKYKTLTGRTLTTIRRELELHYRPHSHSHARHSKWGSNDDDYDEDDYDEEDYDEDDDDEEDDWQHQFSPRKRFS
ncbi:hypothetical protein AOLI_G00271830 [Acnodon oligacanthus]